MNDSDATGRQRVVSGRWLVRVLIFYPCLGGLTGFGLGWFADAVGLNGYDDAELLVGFAVAILGTGMLVTALAWRRRPNLPLALGLGVGATAITIVACYVVFLVALRISCGGDRCFS